MKIIQMTGPSHAKGGGWAPETAPGAARPPARTSGTVPHACPSSVVCLPPRLSPPSSAPSPGKGRPQNL